MNIPYWIDKNGIRVGWIVMKVSGLQRCDYYWDCTGLFWDMAKLKFGRQLPGCINCVRGKVWNRYRFLAQNSWLHSGSKLVSLGCVKLPQSKRQINATHPKRIYRLRVKNTCFLGEIVLVPSVIWQPRYTFFGNPKIKTQCKFWKGCGNSEAHFFDHWVSDS